ncbi:MAG: O-antigen ligase family protein [Coriobacteriia bacterium]|nr:O-antigen ligase family protein [Coriobacteriia bacterium]MBN2840205.1 O-antigen ligase family protein [Coriobacteriia bacterium]
MVGFALIVYVVIDGFSHGMFDLQIMPAVSLTALATFAALTLAMIDGRANRSLRAPWMYGTGAALTLFVGCLALAAALGHGGFDLGFVKNLALFTAIVALVRSPRRLSWLLAVAGAAGVLQATLGIRQVVLAHGIPAGGVTGLLPNHVQYAMYMTLSVIALAPFVLRTYGLRRVAIVAAEALMLGVIVASLARGVLVVAVVCALVFVLITLRSVAARVLASAGTLALAAGALVASDRLGTLIKIPAALGDPVRLDALLSGRLPMLLAAWNMWAAQPVVGVGYGRFPELWSHYVPPGIGIPGVLRLELAAHSTYLQIAAELGVVGLGLYIWLLASGLRDAALARRGFKRSAEATGSWMAAAILVGLLAVTLHGVLDNTGWHDRVLYILLALSVAARGLAPEGMPRLTGEAT